MPNEKFDNILLIGLLTLTIIILLLHKFSFNRSIVIDVNTPYNTKAITDNSLTTQESSKATLITNKDHFLLDCHIKASDYAWPFCELAFSFEPSQEINSPTPLDLSSFTNVNVSAKYIGEVSAGIRLQLRTFNSEYSTLDNDATWKYNGLEYWPDKNNYPVSVPLNGLQVATWWLIEQEIPIEFSGPEFNQVMVLEIATGNNIAPGHYQLKVEKIEFLGKIFSNLQIFYFTLSMWIVAAISGLFINLKRSKQKLAHSIRRTKELRQLNSLLNVESLELKNKSERDALTGALNRSGIQSVFTNELKVLTLIFIDIDHFKSINDNYGHAIGDEILIEFTKVISKNCRSTDFLARWGGEEFLLICPNTNANEAFELAESLRLIINEHRWVHNAVLTASFGVAQKSEETINECIERADQALYAAKSQGRNTVILSNNTIIDSSISF
jgi:diguanylate cyclase (GGDEF)-like protein